MDNENKKLEEEIKALEEEINNTKKDKRIKNLKIYSKTMHRIAPYVLSAGIIAGTFKIVGGVIPFYNDTVKRTADIMNEFDENGRLIRTEKIYGNFNEEERINRLIYYSNWQKNKNNQYEREIISYKISKKNLANIISLLGQDNVSLEDILPKPYMHTYESKETISDNELKEESFIKVIAYSRDKDDYIMAKQGISGNFADSFLYTVIYAISYLVIGLYRDNYSSFIYSEEIRKINNEYKSLPNINELKKELKIKKRKFKK